MKRKAAGGADACPLPASVEVQMVRPADGEPGPLVFHFPSGYQPLADSTCQWKFLRQPDGSREHALVAETVRSETGVSYIGTTSGGDNMGRQPCRYVLGLLDKRAGTLRCAEVGTGAVMRMEPRAAGYDYGPRAGGAGAPEADLATRLQQNKRLVEAFGSARRARKQAAREAFAVDIERLGDAEGVAALVQGDIARAGGGAPPPSQAQDPGVAAAERGLPPHHAEAITPGEAYRLEEVVPERAWSHLEGFRLQKAALNAEYRAILLDRGVFPKYVLERVAGSSATRSAEDTFRFQAYALLGALCTLRADTSTLRLDGARRDVAWHSRRLKLQADVLDALLHDMRLYECTEAGEEGQTAFRQSREQRALMLETAVLAALGAEGWALSADAFHALRAELRATPQQLVAAFRNLGCVCKAAAAVGDFQRYSVQLLPPVQPPKPLSSYLPKLKPKRMPKKR